MFQGVKIFKMSFLAVFLICYVINILPFGEAWWGLYLVEPLFS